MLSIKQENDIKKGHRYITLDLNTNSKIYLNGDTMTKFPTKYSLVKNKCLEEVLRYIYEIEYSSCIEIKNLVYGDKHFVGYSFKYYKDYNSLRKLFNKPISLKKQYCIEINNAFEKLSDNNLQYGDSHCGNFLIGKDGKGIICDLDSMKINKNNDNRLYNRYLASLLCLAYLYNIETEDVMALIRNRDDFLLSENNFLFKYFYDLRHGENRKISELIDLITETDIIERKKFLKSKTKQLKDNPYFRNIYI